MCQTFGLTVEMHDPFGNLIKTGHDLITVVVNNSYFTKRIDSNRTTTLNTPIPVAIKTPPAFHNRPSRGLRPREPP